jgi:hypothetical protein
MQPDKRSVSPSFIADEELDIVESIQCAEKSIKKVVFSYFGGEPVGVSPLSAWGG